MSRVAKSKASTHWPNGRPSYDWDSARQQASQGPDQPENGIENVLLDTGVLQHILNVLTDRSLHGSEEGERVEGVVDVRHDLVVGHPDVLLGPGFRRGKEAFQ